MAVILGMAAIAAWAIMTARVSYVVTHGVSMNPVYYQGGLVLTVRADSYEVGQIVAYHGFSPGQRVLHRIIGGDGDAGFVVKGDNSQSVDPLKPTANELIGRAVLHVPKVGAWLEPLLGPSGLGVIGFLVVSSGAATARTRREIPRGRRKKRAKAMAPHGGGSWAMAAALLKAVGRLSTPFRVAAGSIVVAIAFALVLGVLGWMKPLTYVQDARPGLDESITFSYTASVPRSAAYDGTTVNSPDPIFRKLTNNVNLGLSYRGSPGTLEVAARLTNGTGWHTTIALAPPKKITGDRHATTVTLNLNEFDDRAIAAAEAIGVPPAPVAISITARISGPDRRPFAAALQFNMTSVQFSLVNGPTSLVVTDAAEQPSKIRVVREIKPFGYSIMTASQARSYAVLIALCALIGAAIIALIARSHVPLRTRAEIERRYANMLVPVEPMASPPGKPVVNVDNFPALVRLAERYGQMILTWRRPDADDFVVRDEGITYRYRIPLEEATLQNIERVDGSNGTGSHRRKASSRVS